MSHEHTIDVLRELGEYLPGSGMRERLALLALVEYDEAVPMGDFAQRLGISRGALTSLADNLEDRELCVRVHSREDRRVVTLEVTQAGRDIVESASNDALNPADAA